MAAPVAADPSPQKLFAMGRWLSLLVVFDDNCDSQGRVFGGRAVTISYLGGLFGTSDSTMWRALNAMGEYIGVTRTGHGVKIALKRERRSTIATIAASIRRAMAAGAKNRGSLMDGENENPVNLRFEIFIAAYPHEKRVQADRVNVERAYFDVVEQAEDPEQEFRAVMAGLDRMTSSPIFLKLRLEGKTQFIKPPTDFLRSRYYKLPDPAAARLSSGNGTRESRGPETSGTGPAEAYDSAAAYRSPRQARVEGAA